MPIQSNCVTTEVILSMTHGQCQRVIAVAFKSRGSTSSGKQDAVRAPSDSPQTAAPVRREQAIAVVAAAVEQAVVNAGGKVHVDLKHPEVGCNTVQTHCLQSNFALAPHVAKNYRLWLLAVGAACILGLCAHSQALASLTIVPP